MSNAAHWRNFCMRAPRPVLVRVFAGEDVHDIRPDEQENWARLGETIEALDPDRIELYGESENLLRADKRKIPREAQDVRIPDALHRDPETARLTHFSNLIHRSYQHTTEVAFNRFGDFLQLLSEREQVLARRVAELETEVRELGQENAELRAVMQAGGAAASDGSPNDIVSSFIQGMMGGGGKPPKSEDVS